ncbi:DoxX family protein [Brachybacterium huguangmaarense]
MSTKKTTAEHPRTSQEVARIGLGAAMVFAGTSHLTFARQDFQAQVPPWVPMSEDAVVLLSGVAEIGLGAAMLALPRHRRLTGSTLAAFYAAVFPGNISQYSDRRDAFGLDTDRKRLVRLFGQPALIAAALWAGGRPLAD